MNPNQNWSAANQNLYAIQPGIPVDSAVSPSYPVYQIPSAQCQGKQILLIFFPFDWIVFAN